MQFADEHTGARSWLSWLEMNAGLRFKSIKANAGFVGCSPLHYLLKVTACQGTGVMVNSGSRDRPDG